MVKGSTVGICLLIFYTWISAGYFYALENELSNFFTAYNASSNIPRIGRSGKTDFENFFLKASKSVPRIGRQTENSENFDSLYFKWMKQNGLIPRYAKRFEYPKKEYANDPLEYNFNALLLPEAVAELLQQSDLNQSIEKMRYKRDGHQK